MGACTAFIFAALIEFTIANYLWRKGRKGSTISSKRMIETQQVPRPNLKRSVEYYLTIM